MFSKEFIVSIGRKTAIFLVALFLSLSLPSLYALDDQHTSKPVLDQASAQMVGVWEIVQTKEPGKPYQTGYKGRPFVTKGANAFTLILEYHEDGTFRRLERRAGMPDKAQEGTWKLSGHELRHRRKGAQNEEVMYIRFDGPNRYTSIEVFEKTTDPGLFAQFERKKQ